MRAVVGLVFALGWLSGCSGSHHNFGTAEAATGGVAAPPAMAGSGGQGDDGSRETGGSAPAGVEAGSGTAGSDAERDAGPSGPDSGPTTNNANDAATSGPLCPVIDLPLGGALKVETPAGRSPGALAHYSCATGHTLSGPTSQSCGMDGSWAGAQPTCEAVDCGPRSAPSRGSVALPAGTTFGAVASYSCDLGYTLVGDAMQTCLASAQWNNSQPRCEDADCTSALCTADYPCQDLTPGYRCLGQFADWTASDSPSSFTINADDTVSDGRSGLIWQRSLDSNTHDWNAAKVFCGSLALAGHSDWRLPTRAELQSLVDYTKAGPATDSVVFPDGTGEALWTSSPHATTAGVAWSVNFFYGVTQMRTTDEPLFARCVRSTAPGVATAGSGGLPPGRYELPMAGAILDKFTGLSWQQGGGEAGGYTQTAAASYCGQLTLAGGGWRLPSISELSTLTDPTAVGQGLDAGVFSNTSPLSNYWTSSPTESWVGRFWHVSLPAGDSNFDEPSLLCAVRCVR